MTYKWKNGSWQVEIKIDPKAVSKKGGKENYYKEGDLKEAEAIIEEVINKKIKDFKPGKEGNSPVTDQTTTQPLPTPEDGGAFKFGDGLNWWQWATTLADAGVSIYENAALPEVYWNKSDAKYNDYPLHTPPLFSGVADGVIDEVTAIPQLVKLGVEVTTDKEKAKALWNSVKKISFTSIKNAAEGAVKNKWENIPTVLTILLTTS